MRLWILVAGLTGTVALVAAGCSGSSDSSGDATTAPKASATAAATQSQSQAATATATTSTGVTPAASATSSSQTSRKVSANNATRAELTAAFEAAGIPSAANWAREVEEYRPYATTDTNLAKLRQNLAKYNPGPGVVDAIVAALSLP